MSIINEALKKTEESIQKNSVKEKNGQDNKTAINPFVIYLLIFITGLFLITFIFAAVNRKAEQPPSAADKPLKAAQISDKKTETLPLSQPEPAAMPEEPVKPKKKFILSGIFFSDNDGYALVNNQIIRENDSIEGAKVKKITANSVELNNEGEIITLSNSR
jgi:type II secretory pathway component PulC